MLSPPYAGVSLAVAPYNNLETPERGTRVAERILWQEGFGPTRAAAECPAWTEVAVVGGGLTGLSAALELASQGVETVVFDQGRLGNGASGRNGGQVLTGLNPGLRRLRLLYGERVARLLWEEARAAVAWIEALVREGAIACDWHRGGHLALAPDGAGLRRLEDEARMLRRFGYPGRIMDAGEVRQSLGFGSWAGALHDSESATVNPYRLARGIAAMALDRGAVVIEGAEARVERRPGGFRIATERGTTHARHVLYATNAWLADGVPSLTPRIVPVEGSMLATPVLPPTVREALLPGRPAVFEESWRVVHFQKTPDGRIVFGGRSPTPGPDGLRHLLWDVIPALRDVQPEFFWHGPLAITVDGVPRLHRTEDGVYWAGGYSGHGVALAVWLGRGAARWIRDGRRPPWLTSLPPPFPERIGPFHRYRLLPPKGPSRGS
jgi:gamma-glutamylputrescine oxidase